MRWLILIETIGYKRLAVFCTCGWARIGSGGERKGIWSVKKISHGQSSEVLLALDLTWSDLPNNRLVK